MKNTAKIKLKNRIRKLLSDKRGFSLGELLAATVILLLASQVMTQGMAFATRMYKESLTRSHAKQLCSTLTNVIEKELRYTTSVNKGNDGTVLKYFSPTYGKTESAFAAIDENENKIDSAEPENNSMTQETQTPQQTVDAQQMVIPQESERILT